MGSIVSIKSKTKLGCNICDKCCINRGDIKITPVNVIEISQYMGISLHEFIEQYTENVENQPLEIVIKAIGSHRRCILNDSQTYKCKVHPAKPMQCVTFPLIPIYLEKDIFYKQDTCVCENQEEMAVLDWLNGKNGIYVKYKKIYMEWISFVEEMQKKWDKVEPTVQNQIFNLLYYNYENKCCGSKIEKSVRNNIRKARRLVKATK